MPFILQQVVHPVITRAAREPLFCSMLSAVLVVWPLAIGIPACAWAKPPAADAVSVVAFGSCIKQDRPLPILPVLASHQPQLTLLTGDNIYGDTEDMELLRKKYALLARAPGFRELRANTRMLGTWDDHDFGVNDGGRDYPQREASQKVFLDFWRVPSDSPRRRRPGVYHSVILGPPGKRLQVVLLDTRYFRSPLRRGERRVGGPYYPDMSPGKTMLGAKQWRWLEQRLREPADVRLIVSSVQCLAEAAGQETWSNLPLERSRFLQLLQSTRAEGVVLLSGDRHWSEVSSVEIGYPLVEITCSSLNQKHPRGTPTENRHRMLPTTVHDVNFGLLKIDWEADDPAITAEIRGLDNRVKLRWQNSLSHLQFSESASESDAGASTSK